VLANWPTAYTSVIDYCKTKMAAGGMVSFTIQSGYVTSGFITDLPEDMGTGTCNISIKGFNGNIGYAEIQLQQERRMWLGYANNVSVIWSRVENGTRYIAGAESVSVAPTAKVQQVLDHHGRWIRSAGLVFALTGDNELTPDANIHADGYHGYGTWQFNSSVANTKRQVTCTGFYAVDIANASMTDIDFNATYLQLKWRHGVLQRCNFVGLWFDIQAGSYIFRDNNIVPNGAYPMGVGNGATVTLELGGNYPAIKVSAGGRLVIDAAFNGTVVIDPTSTGVVIDNRPGNALDTGMRAS
jgi:hypothetical protein